MAPKSPAKRVTRARAAAKNEDVLSGPARKPAPSKVTKTTTSTRKTKVAKEDKLAEEVQEDEPPKKATARTTTKTTTLAAAPRRRIKVTPLNPPPVEEPVPDAKPASKAKKTTTRSKKTVEEKAPAEEVAPEAEAAPIKASTRTTKTTRTTKDKTEAKESVAPKTRGRPKKTTTAESEEVKEPEPAKPTRQTRTRTASVTESVQDPEPAKTKAKTLKKVTFQDVPEDDKENVPVPMRKAVAKKETPATGMRAKPVRKPSAAPKKASTTTTRATRGKVEKPAPRALTPKKITQLNRPATPESSDDEDELNSAKTPVRDLSLSPRRNAQLAATMSPTKKLDFAQSLAPQSPFRPTESTLMSPARRPHSSPEKDDAMKSPLKESPKRGDFAPLFPSTSQNVTAHTALVPNTQANLQQSPKRVQLDASAFSQSAMKPQTSPFKASLLQSPARRLFSPKKGTPAAGSKVFADVSLKGTIGTPEDVAVTSHFRASVSPQRSVRVHRMSDEELADELSDAMDFDQSVLNVRSPLKIVKEKPFVPVLEEAQDEIDEDTANAREENENDLPAVVEEMLHDSEAVQLADPADIAVVLPKNDQQAVLDEMVQDSAAINAASPSEIEVALPAHEEDLEQAEFDEEQGELAEEPFQAPSSAGRLSEVLFRSEGVDEESSEDELAVGEKTPARALPAFRSSLFGADARSRLSTGIPPSGNRNIGFTPLAAQMSGWLAASPEKKAMKKTPKSRGMFSPIAAEHIDGGVVISRQSTPQQKTPAARLSTSKRQSFVPALSISGSQTGTPDKPSFFEDQMASHEADEQANEAEDEQPAEVDMQAEVDQIDEALASDDSEIEEVEDEQMSDTDATMLIKQPSGELTTDLINFTNASDTAVVDFENLAQEAEQLHEQEVMEEEIEEEYGDENTAPLEAMDVTQMIRHTTAQEHFAQYPMQSPAKLLQPQQPAAVVVEEVTVTEEAEVSAEPASSVVPEPSVALEPASPSRSPPSELEIATPVQRDFSKPRFLNTVVSKVPLRPEGHISPIKMPKKRARSLSNTNQDSPPKRAALTPIGKPAPRATSDNTKSPSRRIRSAAPSPAVTTPGQMSFAIDDFGDSTLDGIEMPGDDMMDFDMGNPTATPATAKSTKTIRSTAATPARTPLKQLGEGVLSGTVVYVEVHTTEGADASGVYIDLLTEMGARCVREWKWNPRASINAEDASTSAKVGITHVVYKDGGKRTLEKVRDAKGEVWCVGVRWVLDSQREKKWLDETAYVVDHAILPRGGSRRRKSMEPSRLSNVNGTMSAKSGKRVSSAEFLTNAMREDLINTPVRTFLATDGDANDDDTEISSTYNSPTTTMNVKHPGAKGVYETPEELKGWDPATSATPAPVTPAPFNARRDEGNGLKSAPPKQTGRGLFERRDEGEIGGLGDKENGAGTGVEKLKVKMNGDARRQTMGWVPRVRSPLGKF